ncbi:MAG: hypothetical protein KDA96_07250, partial [Planctomycetaceae bacterium]|nr:hypothetical protein [Planctomycetaceae bacterium]
ALMNTIASAHADINRDRLLNLRLALELLVRQHPEIHDRMSPETLRALMEQFLSGNSPPQQLRIRGDMLQQDVQRLISPAANEVAPIEVRIETLLEEHHRRLDALRQLPDDPEYDIGGLIEDERNRFLENIGELFA